MNCLTTAELKKIWDRGSNVNNWSDVRQGFPNVPLRLFGPGTDSGTFEFFTEKINGRARQSRSDYSASEDDNVLVRGVARRARRVGFRALVLPREQEPAEGVRVNSGNGCVTPSVASVQTRAYKPLSRGLFVYAKKKAFKRDVVAGFIRHMIVNERAISRTAKIVPLTSAAPQGAAAVQHRDQEPEELLGGLDGMMLVVRLRCLFPGKDARPYPVRYGRD